MSKALRALTRLKMPADKAPELSGPIDGLKMLARKG